MQTVKAKHTVGDSVHVKLYYADDRAQMKFYGEVTAANLHLGIHFPDRILYDIYLEQADAPHIRIQNLPEGFILPGGPAIETEQNDDPTILGLIQDARAEVFTGEKDKALETLSKAAKLFDTNLS